MADLAPLVKQAIEIQTKMGYTDERFAEEVLGITKGYWSKLRSGTATGTGGRFMNNLLARFPNLALSLRADVPVVASGSDSEPALNGGLR